MHLPTPKRRPLRPEVQAGRALGATSLPPHFLEAPRWTPRGPGSSSGGGTCSRPTPRPRWTAEAARGRVGAPFGAPSRAEAPTGRPDTAGFAASRSRPVGRARPVAPGLPVVGKSVLSAVRTPPTTTSTTTTQPRASAPGADTGRVAPALFLGLSQAHSAGPEGVVPGFVSSRRRWPQPPTVRRGGLGRLTGRRVVSAREGGAGRRAGCELPAGTSGSPSGCDSWRCGPGEGPGGDTDGASGQGPGRWPPRRALRPAWRRPVHALTLERCTREPSCPGVRAGGSAWRVFAWGTSSSGSVRGEASGVHPGGPPRSGEGRPHPAGEPPQPPVVSETPGLVPTRLDRTAPFHL